jgi:hypothetical protein
MLGAAEEVFDLVTLAVETLGAVSFLNSAAAARLFAARVSPISRTPSTDFATPAALYNGPETSVPALTEDSHEAANQS